MTESDKSFVIDINHVTRVEGHGSIKINTSKGVVEDVRLEIVEANRFFEHFVKGMAPHDIPQTVSRICGICCVGHQLAAIQAVENALRIEPSSQTELLRKAFNESQFLQSHVLHVYFLAVPDYVGVPSVIPLIKKAPEVVKRALRLKKLANDYTNVLGGRTLHPMAATLKGWRKLPDLNELEKIMNRLKEAVPDIMETLKTVKTLDIPPYERETEYISLTRDDEYALLNGDIMSSDTGERVPVYDYKNVTNEFTVSHSTSKWSKWHRDSYMVGALARVNNNFDKLRPEAQTAADELGLKIPSYNPYMNNIAQVVEIVHCAYNSISMIEEILNNGLKEEDISYKAGKGIGYGATEVPRGILFHQYSFDNNGKCDGANAVIPTSQNINNIEQDMKAFVPQMLPLMGKDELALRMEMLLRAYDPCISCSVHMLDVKFVE